MSTSVQSRVRRNLPGTTRRRNAVATREAILASALRAFARAGYDGVGVREIASGAGVTAMLVNRYFGSKERLFAEVVAHTMETPNVITANIINSRVFAKDIAAALVGKTEPGAAPLDGFLIMLRSVSNVRAAAIWREQVESHHHKQLTSALGGRLPAERAALILALIAGFQVLRQMIGISALVEARAGALSGLLTQVFEHLAETELAGGRPYLNRHRTARAMKR
jgi:AcrR family transcriptional regulator